MQLYSITEYLGQPSFQPIDEPLCLVSSWSTQQVCQWLKGLNMEQYIPEFTARDIDGEQLLLMDGTKLKVRGWFREGEEESEEDRRKGTKFKVGGEERKVSRGDVGKWMERVSE